MSAFLAAAAERVTRLMWATFDLLMLLVIVALLALGAWMIYPPAGPITAGLLLALGMFALARGAE